MERLISKKRLEWIGAACACSVCVVAALALMVTTNAGCQQTAAPTTSPTASPTAEPTASPTAEPTASPTAEPTASPTAEPECAEDADCAEGEICVDGECIAAPACETDEDCAEGEVCTDGVCEMPAPECTEDADCEAFETCVDGMCVAIECTEDADCDDALFCNGTETCTDGACAAGEAPCDADTEECDEENDECVVPSVPGETISLTTNVDTVSGTGDDDVVNGVVSATPTLSAGDTINLAGGNDRMNVIMTGADYTPVATIENVEMFYIRNVDTGNARTFSFVAIDGAEQVWADRGLNTLTVNGISELVALGIYNTDQDFTAEFSNTVFSGDDDELMVYLDEAQDGVTLTVQSTGSDGPETINIVSDGDTANELDAIAVGAGETDTDTIVVTGDANVKIQAVPSTIENIDASGAGGTFDIKTDAADANDLTIVGSPQDDIFRMSALGAADSLDGGDGEDQLLITGTFGAAEITNVETAEIDNSGTSVSVDLSDAQDFTEVTVDNSGALATITFTGLPEGFTGIIDSDTSYTISNASSFALDADADGGSADELTLELTGSGTASFTQVLATNEVEIFNIDTTVPTLTLNAADVLNSGSATLKTVNFSGSSAVTISNTLSASNELTAVNAADMTGSITMTSAANGGGAITLTGGPGNDTLLGGAGADTLKGGNGNDTIDGAAGNDTATGGSGIDTFLFRQATASNSVEVDDFTAGTGGDVLLFDISDLGLAGGTEYVGAVGAVAVNSSEEIVILTGTGYATDEAAEDAIAARVTTDGLDMVIVYFNTTSNQTHVILDPDAGVDGNGTAVLIGTLSNITTQGAHDGLNAGNINSQA